jgi:uncharacterized membrane protein SpoIIM required for sporulation
MIVIILLVLCTNKMYRNNIYNRTFGDFFSHRKKVLKISFLVYWFKHLILQVFLCTFFGVSILLQCTINSIGITFNQQHLQENYKLYKTRPGTEIDKKNK